jgi:hypothetical protein
MAHAEEGALAGMEPEREAWVRRVAAAAQNAAMELRRLDDPSTQDLLADLDELRERLDSELRASGLEPG